MAPILVSKTYKRNVQRKKKRPYNNFQNVFKIINSTVTEDSEKSLPVFDALYVENIKKFKSKLNKVEIANKENFVETYSKKKNNVEENNCSKRLCISEKNSASTIQDFTISSPSVGESTFDKIRKLPELQPPKIHHSSKTSEYSSSSINTSEKRYELRSSASETSCDLSMFSSLRKARNELQTLGIKELSISQVPAKLRMSSLKTVSKVNTCLTSTPNGKIEEKNEEKSPHFSPISINFNKQCRTVSDVTTDRIESQSALSHPGQCVSIQVIGKSDNDVNTETSVHPELIEEYNSDLPCNDIQLVSADWQNEDESKFRKLSLPADVINLVPDTSVSNIFASLESSDSKVARDVSRHGEYSESMTEVSCVKNRSTKSDYHCDSIVNTSDTNNVDKLNEDSDVKLQESEKDFKKSSSSDSFLGFSSVSDAQSSYHIPESSRLEFSESDMMNIKSANERELVAAENVTQDCKSEVNESALNSVVMPIHLSNLVLIDSNCDFENSIDCIESSIGPECNRNLALSISCNQSEMNQERVKESSIQDGTSFNLSEVPLILRIDSLQIVNREKSRVQGQLCESNIKQTMSPLVPNVDHILHSSDLRTSDCHHFKVARQSCQYSKEENSVHNTLCDLSDLPLIHVRDSVRNFNREKSLAQECEVISVQDEQLCEGNAIFRKPASIDHNTSLERKRSLRRLSCRRRSHVVIPSHVQEELQQCSPSFRDVYHVPTNIYTTKCRRNIIASPIEEDEEEEVSLTEESFVHEPEFFTARSAVLQRCNQKNPVPFSVAYPPSYWSTCTKIGEGVYGEVFMSEGEDKSVLKIIPIEGDCLVNGEPQKKFEEILSEIVIAMELSNLRSGKENSTHSFSEMKRCSCVQGEYPKQLINLWDEYNENKGSENDSPSMFREDQLYIILELANGGRDLEAYHFNNAAQSHSIFVQTAFALAVAEMALEFEHRDLHWGNVLISETVQKTVVFRICGQEFSVPTKGVQVTIIDFTLSRMSYDGCCIYNDLSKDPTLFTAVGDYQFEIYRLMRDSVQDKWDIFKPFTNILWLHYLLEKMCTLVNYRRKSTRLHKQGIEELKKLYKVVLDHQSATDFVLSNLVE
ncbi:uncharacterized protein [Periplaneta americana]|uniref:uncharacterized protein isoform X3 n=1 Tax=Periplaneta americana TaxID=6978 RepID=UPI0037E74E38